MCVIYFSFDQRSDIPLILIANRDEYYDRPTAPASYWSDHPNIYGGRDLKGGGTWLGVTKAGRFSAVTNYRDPSAPSGLRSRGDLVAEYLKGDQPASEYLADVARNRDKYSGFNLLVGTIGERKELFYYSNRSDKIIKVSDGVYGLSNHLLDTPWPKIVRGKRRFTELLTASNLSNADLFDLLTDEMKADDNDLPSTGITYEAEKAISSIFIKTPGYGTRSSTVLRFDADLQWSFQERIFI